MAYRKNIAGQEFNVLAINASTGLPITGDALNITAKISKDSGAFAAVSDTNPTELDATNAAGVYVFELSQAETNGNVLTIVASSTTANVQMDMLNIYTSEVKSQLDDIEDVVGDIDVATTSIESKTSQLTFTVSNQVDANALTGGTSAADIYSYFTTGTNENAFKADVTTLESGGVVYQYVEQTWESVGEDPEGNLYEPIADKVWDTVASQHQTAGSTGKALTDASAVGGDATAAKQNEILGKLATSSVVYTNPSSPNKLTLIRGDAYDDAAENNGKLTWATGKTLTGATVRFTIRDASDNILIDQTTAGVSTAVDSQTAEVSLTSAATALLTVATTNKFDAEAYWAADNRWTFARGTCIVLEDQTRS